MLNLLIIIMEATGAITQEMLFLLGKEEREINIP